MKKSLDDIYLKAKELADPVQRGAYLAEACCGDPALQACVETLLQEALEAEDYFENQGTIGVEAPLPTEDVGSTIGRYKLLQKLGEGGMGVVYMAEQREPVVRKVALKIIKLGMDTRQIVGRFEAERQALALMDHPNIAKVLEAGTSEQGRPYFVMELVRGIKITAYCDENHLSTEQRLDLFVQVCHAVQHAHQKGIIHRDLKPSNLLVADHDGVPVPKVIDFGIAKAISDQRLTNKTVFTAFEQFIGTPAYMSPEQAKLSGLDIDTRADIYSLGVLLYELLTGKTPFDQRELLAAGWEEMRRTIREEEPVRPSTRLSSLRQDELTTTAKRRRLEPSKLAGRLRGDLDWIVMKCLEKDRARRYPTASDLAADLKRHLGNEPVTACPPSRLYQFQKLLRRNRLAFLTVGTVITALSSGLGFSLWSLGKERDARHRAVEAERQAEAARQNEAQQRSQAEAGERKAASESAKSQQVAQFLKNMLSGLGSPAPPGRDGTMLRFVLDGAAERVNRELKNQPEVEAEMRLVIGRTYRSINRFVEAENMDRSALAMFQKLHGNEHPSVALALAALGDDMSQTTHSEESEPLCRAALAMWRSVGDPKSLELADLLSTLAGVLLRKSQTSDPSRNPALWAEAEQLERESVAIRRKHFAEDSAEIAQANGKLAEALGYNSAEGKVAEALRLLRDEVATLKRLRGEDHVSVGAALLVTANILRNCMKYAEAEALLRQTLAIYRKHWASDSTAVGYALRHLDFVLYRQGKFAEAEAADREALAICKKAYGDDHPQTVGLYDNLTRMVLHQGKLDEATALYQEQIDLMLRYPALKVDTLQMRIRNTATLLKEKGWNTQADALLSASEKLLLQRLAQGAETAQGTNWLADVYSDQGRHAEAEVVHRREWERIQREAPDNLPKVAVATLRLAQTLGRAHRHAEGEALRRELLARQREKLGPDHPDIVTSLRSLAGCVQAQGRWAESEPMLREALAMWTRIGVPGEVESPFSNSIFSLSEALLRQGRLAEAEQVLDERLKDLRARRPDDQWGVSEMEVALTRVLLKEEKFPQAEPLAREALGFQEKKLPDAWATFETRSLLGESLLGQNRWADAGPLLLSGYEGMKRLEDKIMARDRVRLREALQRLAKFEAMAGQPDRAAAWQRELEEFDRRSREGARKE